jgi:hypothetical protein
LTYRLQAPDKEATVRFTVDMSVGRALQIVNAGNKNGRKKVDAVRIGGWVEKSGA